LLTIALCTGVQLRYRTDQNAVNVREPACIRLGKHQHYPVGHVSGHL